MDKEQLTRWRQLHLRVACGESLFGEEDAVYKAGLRELEGNDDLGAATVTRLQETRRQLALAEAEHADLLARRQKLEARIAALEAALGNSAKTLQTKGD